MVLEEASVTEEVSVSNWLKLEIRYWTETFCC